MAAPREPQDRKPRTTRKATVRKPTAAEMSTVDPTPAERLEAEVEALDATDWQTVPLGSSGTEVRVLPFSDWPRSVYRRLNAGDFEAVGAIVHEEDLPIWDAWDSTMGELAELGLLLVIEGGQQVGESAASKAQSRSMRRR
jgi:hypothetical protein